MDNTAARAFSARLAFWTARGFSGAELFQHLASDDELPAIFDSDAVAAIQGITPLAVKKSRSRGVGPDFIRISPKAVRYPRASLCHYLASRYVRRAA